MLTQSHCRMAFQYVFLLTQFAVLTSTVCERLIQITHVLLWHGKEIKKALFNPVYSVGALC